MAFSRSIDICIWTNLCISCLLACQAITAPQAEVVGAASGLAVFGQHALTFCSKPRLSTPLYNINAAQKDCMQAAATIVKLKERGSTQ